MDYSGPVTGHAIGRILGVIIGRIIGRAGRGAGALAGICLLAACASPSMGNAPPAVVDECRQEVAELTDREYLPPPAESLPDDPGPEATTIDKDRVAEAEADGSALANWPEDALLYRCFTSRGVVLTREQAMVLAEWQGRTEAAEPQTSE